MTLLGLTDGCNADTGHGYLDIVDFIIQDCCDVESNLKELFRRVAFNICIGNTDDHFRNHGFLLTPRGWTLSPAYDMNPTHSDYQSLLITPSTNKSDLNLLLESAEDYLLTPAIASSVIYEVQSAVKSWRQLAVSLSIPSREQQLFAPVFNRHS